MTDKNDHHIDRLIRQHLDAQADEVDIARFVERVNLSCARTRRIRRRVMLFAAAAALVIAVCYSAIDTGSRPDQQSQSRAQDTAAGTVAVDDIITLLDARGSQLVAAADVKFRQAELAILDAVQRRSRLTVELPYFVSNPDFDLFAELEADMRKFRQDIVRLIDQAIAEVEMTI